MILRDLDRPSNLTSCRVAGNTITISLQCSNDVMPLTSSQHPTSPKMSVSPPPGDKQHPPRHPRRRVRHRINNPPAFSNKPVDVINCTGRGDNPDNTRQEERDLPDHKPDHERSAEEDGEVRPCARFCRIRYDARDIPKVSHVTHSPYPSGTYAIPCLGVAGGSCGAALVRRFISKDR